MFIFLRKDRTLYPLQGMRVRTWLRVWRRRRCSERLFAESAGKGTQENLGMCI